ncbi:acyl-CoA dehydrogenase [Sandarakinorhabdus cyanobacteriorum]|uniref:Acyl-CoA dehydrogenase n=1 Tax=Sandarakinorhabdus cyanobacteriorum TaxID=1981098 RepID=A0A255YIK9_9SPHN|nr:acyl-CoA dehydrogenase family protein [Sandarakinorhabdus cyanobacteriorum]OYQ28300.1 acyl-CoA dehydrogenase [Sandarakinorhabdus cyanobacteriorum]
MQLAWSSDDLRFRDEVREFLASELTPELKAAAAGMTSVYAPPPVAIAWQKKLHAKGWVAPSWPVEWGGCDWSVARRYIFARETSEAGAPPLSPMGLGMCGPVLLHYGTEEQKRRHLPPMLAGDIFWCQGYSEPNSGSDLASLQMKAERDGDHFVCTGRKIWTTHAHYADWIFCLVRTTRLEKPQLGISFLLIDTKSPGVSVRPIISLSGEHVQNEVIFDDVRVPVANVVGQIDDGWTVAKYLMEFERGGHAYAPSLIKRVDVLRRHLAETGQAMPGRLAALRTEIEALDAQELIFNAGLSNGAAPGPMASALKIIGTELSQRLTELEVEAALPHAIIFQPHRTLPGGDVPGYVPPTDGLGVGPDWAARAIPKYFNDRAGSIYAGTNEIQRGILWQYLARRNG